MRRFLLVLFALLVAAPVSAQVWVATDVSDNYDDASGTTLATFVALTVGADDAILVCAFNDGDQENTSVADGTHTYTPLTERSFGGARVRLFYTMATSAGSYTPTVTYGGSAIYRGIVAQSYSRTGTASFVTENGGNGSSGSIDSGGLTTTGTSDLLTVACATSSGLAAQADHAVNGMTASGVVPTGFNQTYWDLRNHSSGSGSATATVSGGDNWVVVAGAFVSSVSPISGGPAIGSVAAVGAGR